MAEPATRRTDSDGGKYYLHPFRTDDAGNPRRYLSVTTVLDVLNKKGLKFWAAKGSAQRAMENLPKLNRAAFIEPCGDTWKVKPDPATGEPPRCNVCSECITRWVELWHHAKSEDRKREGSMLHDILEWWVLNGAWPSYDESLEPYVKQMRQWVEDYGIEPESFEASEMTVYHHQHGYAGTLDGILNLKPVTEKAAKLCARIGGLPLKPQRVVMDAKSREGEEKRLYVEHTLQMAPYRFASHCLPKTGSLEEIPMPPTQGAVIFQPRPDGYTFEPVRADARALTAFIHALDLYKWLMADGESSILVGAFPVPEGFQWSPIEMSSASGATATTGAKKTARKAAPRKATSKTASTAMGQTASSPRMASATLDAIANSGGGRAGSTLTDDDIPF
jgi:hypothetical protein